MDNVILRTMDLTKKYNNKAVVDNLNIEIRRGKYLDCLDRMEPEKVPR